MNVLMPGKENCFDERVAFAGEVDVSGLAALASLLVDFEEQRKEESPRPKRITAFSSAFAAAFRRRA